MNKLKFNPDKTEVLVEGPFSGLGSRWNLRPDKVTLPEKDQDPALGSCWISR